MALLTVAQIRAHVETGLSDEALQRLLDDADAEIVEVAGAVDSETDSVSQCELANALFLSRRASTVTEVVETVGDDDTTLDATDYALDPDGLRILRLATGPNPRATWGESVIIEFTPRDSTAKRVRVLIDLVRLAADYDAKQQQTDGSYSETKRDYETERTRLLSRLRGGLPFA